MINTSTSTKNKPILKPDDFIKVTHKSSNYDLKGSRVETFDWCIVAKVLRFDDRSIMGEHINTLVFEIILNSYTGDGASLPGTACYIDLDKVLFNEEEYEKLLNCKELQNSNDDIYLI